MDTFDFTLDEFKTHEATIRKALKEFDEWCVVEKPTNTWVTHVATTGDTNAFGVPKIIVQVTHDRNGKETLLPKYTVEESGKYNEVLGLIDAYRSLIAETVEEQLVKSVTNVDRLNRRRAFTRLCYYFVCQADISLKLWGYHITLDVKSAGETPLEFGIRVNEDLHKVVPER
jgi:hypothetical protein